MNRQRACRKAGGGLGLVAVLVMLGCGVPVSAQEVTPDEVKRFLDPIVMIHSFDFTFNANFLGGETRLDTATLSPFWALSGRQAVWAEVPFLGYSLPGTSGPNGIEDVTVGWGALLHEDLGSRFTTSAVIVEAVAPTGSIEEGTGFGTWVLAPGGALVFNPTDVFPVYVVGRYLHSLAAPGGEERVATVGTQPSLRVRSVELGVATVHILPKGFYVSATPNVVLNYDQDFNFFSLAIGGGRALSRNFALQGLYVQHLAGEKTFGRSASISLQFAFGERKDW